MYPVGDPRRETEYPIDTPSITHPKYSDPTKANYSPGRVSDGWRNVRVHLESFNGRPDSNGCLTVSDKWNKTIKEVMMRNIDDGGTRITYK